MNRYTCFVSNANTFDYLPTIYVHVCILCLSCKVQNTCQILLKRVESRIVSIIFFYVFCPCYTVTISDCLLFMNQVPGDCYMCNIRIVQKFICINLLYRKCNDCRINNVFREYKIPLQE